MTLKEWAEAQTEDAWRRVIERENAGASPEVIWYRRGLHAGYQHTLALVKKYPELDRTFGAELEQAAAELGIDLQFERSDGLEDDALEESPPLPTDYPADAEDPEYDRAARKTIRTEDGIELELGARAYNYYDMKPGTIGRVSSHTSDPDPWFDFDHDDGTHSLLNGSRICTLEYARRRGFKGA